MQEPLIEPVHTKVSDLIDLRLGSCTDSVLRGDLAIADPPWLYYQKFGATGADDHYAGLPIPEIERHLGRIQAPRLAVWNVGPIDEAEWPRQIRAWGRAVSRGCWAKIDETNEGHYGQGYYWAGCAEFVSLYTRPIRVDRPWGRELVTPYIDRGVKLRNVFWTRPLAHSWKPVEWMASWIRRWCPPGGTVVDPYAGLGSVAHSVLHAGGDRRYIGYEIDPGRHARALELLGAWSSTRFDPVGL